MKRICVYLGSTLGHDERHQRVAQRLGQELANRGLGLVYGGAAVGLMAVLADSLLARGGSVTGVIPSFLGGADRAHQGLTELIWVDSMHARKAQMAELADGFIALPGGLGTLEELLEAWTWAQLGLHDKPCGLLNVAGFYDSLLAFADRAVREGFMRASDRSLLLASESPSQLLDAMAAYRSNVVPKWRDASFER